MYKLSCLFSMRLFDFKCGCCVGMVICVDVSACCSDCDVVCIGYEMCAFKRSRYVSGV